MPRNKKNVLFAMPIRLVRECQILRQGCFYNLACIEHATFRSLCDKKFPYPHLGFCLNALLRSCRECFPLAFPKTSALDLRKLGCRIYGKQFYPGEFLHERFRKLLDGRDSPSASECNDHNRLRKSNFAKSNRTLYRLVCNFGLWLSRKHELSSKTWQYLFLSFLPCYNFTANLFSVQEIRERISN